MNYPLALRRKLISWTLSLLRTLQDWLGHITKVQGAKVKTVSRLHCLSSILPSCRSSAQLLALSTATWLLRAPEAILEVGWQRCLLAWLCGSQVKAVMTSPQLPATPPHPMAVPTLQIQRAQQKSRAQGLQPRPVPPTTTTSATKLHHCPAAIPLPALARPKTWTQSGRDHVRFPPP